MESEFWEAGFQYKPNQRLDLQMAYGDRSYEETLRGSLVYTLRRGNLMASYSESPTTRAELAFNPRPLVDTDNLDGILDRPGASDRFIRRRSDVSMSIGLAKSNFTFRVFHEVRDNRTTADGTPLADEEFSGAALRWSWNMGVKTTTNVGVDVSERDEERAKDDLFRAYFDIEYELSQRSSLRAEINRSVQEGRESSSFDYVENQLRLYFSLEF